MGRRDRDQLDLLGTAPAPVVRPVRQYPPARGRRSGLAAANPQMVKDVLAEVQLGRFGLLDHTDRIVVFEEAYQVRGALDEDLVHHLLRTGYIDRCPARDTITCRHGAVRKPVLPLRLTRSGRETLHRWTALHGGPA